MRFKQVGNKRDVAAVVVRNADTVIINRGQPVVLNASGTNDGLAVVLPSTAGAAKSASMFFGVALQDITPNAFGEAQVFGFSDYVIVCRTRTRAASTDSFASVASAPIGAALVVNTGGNYLEVGQTVASTSPQPYAVLAQTLASLASVGSSTSLTMLTSYATAAVKVFLRAM